MVHKLEGMGSIAEKHNIVKEGSNMKKMLPTRGKCHVVLKALLIAFG
jgi:hypothetical protein